MNNISEKLWVCKRKIANKLQRKGMVINDFFRKSIYSIKFPAEAKKTEDSIYLIYTMGKVASMSVLDAITKRLPHVNTFAMHYLSEANLKKHEQQLANSIHIGNRMHKDIHTLHAQRIMECITENPEKRIKIITIVREPLNQIISQVFQQLNLHDIESLRRMTMDNPQINFEYPQIWCKEEMEKFSSIDILNQPFNIQKGYDIYTNENIDLLVIRFENIKDVFSQAMKEMSGVDGWRLGERNISTKKSYSTEYTKFRNELEIETNLINKVYSSDFITHFYSDEEITEFKKLWKSFEQ